MKRNALLIGSFVVAAALIAVAAIFWLSGSDIFSQQQKATVYYQDNVSGLSIGAPVTFRGVTIGQVTDIGIRVDQASLQTTVPVTLKLQPSALNMTDANGVAFDVPTLVAKGLRARLVSQSIVTGQKGVELDFAPATPAKRYGPAQEAEIPAVADRFGALIDQVATLPLRDTVNDIRDTVKELQVALLAVQKTLGGAQQLIGSAASEFSALSLESRKSLAAATEAIRQVQASSTNTLDSITRLATTSQQTVLAAQPELQRTLVGARDATESAKLAMKRVADMAAPEAPLRSDMEAAVKDLSQAARGLRSLSELLEEKPNAIIFGNRE